MSGLNAAPPADGYLERISRELRSDRRPADELRVTPIATVPAGRRELAVAMTTSQRFGVACRLTLRAPAPLDPEGRRLEQTVHLYGPDLDALLGALTEARSRLVAAPPKRPGGTR